MVASSKSRPTSGGMPDRIVRMRGEKAQWSPLMCAELRRRSVEVDQSTGGGKREHDHPLRLRASAPYRQASGRRRGRSRRSRRSVRAGFVLAQTLDEPTRATASAEGQTFDSALAESILVKQRVPVGGKADDIRYKRVER